MFRLRDLGLGELDQVLGLKLFHSHCFQFVAYIITYMDINRIYYWTQLRKETFKQFLFACFCFIKIFIKLIHVPKIITLNVIYQKCNRMKSLAIFWIMFTCFIEIT